MLLNYYICKACLNADNLDPRNKNVPSHNLPFFSVVLQNLIIEFLIDRKYVMK